MNNYLQPISRVLMAAIFIISGLGKLAAFNIVAGMMAGQGFPLAQFFLAGAIATEVLGGLALLIGYKTRYIAGGLFLFLIPATIIFHAVNIGDAAQGQQQLTETLKNLAIMGGLLKFVTDGAGAYSVDQNQAANQPISLSALID